MNQGPRVVSSQMEEEKKGEESDMTDDSEVRRREGITQNQVKAQVPDQAPNKRYGNNDGEGSSSDESYFEEIKRIKAAR